RLSTSCVSVLCLFFTPPATTAIYTLSLHDALPIFPGIGDVYFIILLPAFCSNEDDAIRCSGSINGRSCRILQHGNGLNVLRIQRSEEHTSELQSRENLVCRLLLEKKKEKKIK